MQASPRFNNNGLRFPVNYLNSIKKEISFYPIEKQAQFVDAVTYSNCNNPIFIMQLRNFPAVVSYSQINATSIGNAAYMALHCNDAIVRKKMVDFLTEYKNYLS